MIPKCSGHKVKFEDHGWGKPGPYCEGYRTGAGNKGEITLLDAEDHNRHVEAIKTLADSEHEDEQREKNYRIVWLQELIEKKRRSVKTLEV